MKLKFKIMTILIVIIGIMLLLTKNVEADQSWISAKSAVNFVHEDADGAYVKVIPTESGLSPEKFYMANATANVLSGKGTWLNAPNVYCVELNNHITSGTNYITTAEFKIVNNAVEVNNIEGVAQWRRYEYADRTKLATSSWSQWMAYLLASSRSEAQGLKPGGRYGYYNDVVQNVLWEYFPQYINHLRNDDMYNGPAISGLNPGQSTKIPFKDTALYKESDAFYNYKLNYVAPSQVKTTVKVTSNDDYYFVGPLKINYTKASYDGKLFGAPWAEKTTLTAYNGSTISTSNWDLMNSSKTATIEYPEPNTNFYIRINKSAITSANEGVGTLKFVMSDLCASADFYLMKPVSGVGSQVWTLLAEAKTEWLESDLNLNINIEVEVAGNVKLTKKDKTS